MITLPAKTHIWIAAGVTDLRRGFDGLSALVQTKLEQSPFLGACVCLPRPARRSDQGAVVGWGWTLSVCQTAGEWTLRVAAGKDGSVALTRAQLSMLLEGIDWPRPVRTAEPQLAI